MFGALYLLYVMILLVGGTLLLTLWRRRELPVRERIKLWKSEFVGNSILFVVLGGIVALINWISA